jgi:hypothetical protein
MTRVLLLHSAGLLRTYVAEEAASVDDDKTSAAARAALSPSLKLKRLPPKTAKVAAALWCAFCSCCRLADVVAEAEDEVA